MLPAALQGLNAAFTIEQDAQGLDVKTLGDPTAAKHSVLTQILGLSYAETAGVYVSQTTRVGNDSDRTRLRWYEASVTRVR